MQIWGVVVKNVLDRGDGQCKGSDYFLKERGARGKSSRCWRNIIKNKMFSQLRDLLYKDGRERNIVLLNMY